MTSRMRIKIRRIRKMKMSEMVLSSYVGDGITGMLPRKCVVGE